MSTPQRMGVPHGMSMPYRLDTIIKVDDKLCIDCGHCVAVCPTGAMHPRAMGPEDCEPIDVHLIPRWAEARQFLVTRRSIRVYINKPVEKDKILQVLDVARLAPSAGQSNPAMYQEAKLELFTSAWDEGEDQIARGAPCSLQAWAPKDERTAPQAATIALAYAQLAAHALDLGSSWSGGINTATQAYPPLTELLGLPTTDCSGRR